MLQETDDIIKDLNFDQDLTFEKLSVVFEVDYEDTNFLDIEFGTKAKLDDVQTQPEIRIPKIEDVSYVTIVMVDPDAPNREDPSARCICTNSKAFTL